MIALFNFAIRLISQVSKILANVLVMGSAVMARAFVQAYRQALGSKYLCHHISA